MVVIFLLTGQYMDFYYPDKETIGDGMRMMLRSRHIYILLAGLINIGIGVYFSWHPERWRKLIQVFGSSLIILATFTTVGAFFYEPQVAGLQRTFTLPSLIGLLTGTLLHMLSGIKRRVVESGNQTSQATQLGFLKKDR